jgi:DNA-binding MarR family transcriptional regulator
MPKRVPELELDNQLCFALYDASRAVTRAYAPYLAELGITYPQYLTMLVLWEAQGPMAVGEIGGRLHLDSGTLTPLLKRLADLGLVERNRDPDDERRVLVSLTPAGRSLRGKAASIPVRIAACYRLDPKAAGAMLRDLRSLVAAIEASGCS